jgi:hypothetical protein
MLTTSLRSVRPIAEGKQRRSPIVPNSRVFLRYAIQDVEDLLTPNYAPFRVQMLYVLRGHASRARESSPVRVSSRAAIEARMHAVAVELDFVQPFRSVGRRVDELGELWLDPLRQPGRSGAGLARYRPRRAGSVRRLRCRRMRLGMLAYPSATARRAPTVSAAS